MKRLKDFIGSDLTRVTIPVLFNEPTSFLHRMAEACQFYEFLDKVCLFLATVVVVCMIVFLLWRDGDCNIYFI